MCLQFLLQVLVVIENVLCPLEGSEGHLRCSRGPSGCSMSLGGLVATENVL